MFTKIYQFHNVPPFYRLYRKVVLRLSEHGDVKVLVFRYYFQYIFKCFTAFQISCLEALDW